MKKLTSYHQNFIKGIKLLMAKNLDLFGTKEVAEFLGINYMALYKVLDGSNKPTTELCIMLCQKAGYSANWMFLNKGEIMLQEQATLNKILKKVS